MVTPRKILSISIIALIACGTARSLSAQELASTNPSFEDQGIGVPHYLQPAPARFRAVLGFGGNAGLGLLVPATYLGDVSYQTGISLIEVGFIASSSITLPLPRQNYA